MGNRFTRTPEKTKLESIVSSKGRVIHVVTTRKKRYKCPKSAQAQSTPPPHLPHGLIRVNVVKRLRELKSCNLGTTLLDFTNSQEFNFAEENFLNYKVLKTREVRSRKEKVIRSYDSSYASWFRQLIVCFILRTNCRIHIGGRKTLYPRLQTRASEKKKLVIFASNMNLRQFFV